MRSSTDSYRHSSLAPSPNRNYRHTTPSNYLDLNSSVGASDRAEFRDRYQNRVNNFVFFSIKITFSSIILVCMA